MRSIGELIANQFYLELPSGEVREITLDVGLDRDRSERNLRALLTATQTGTRMEVIARTVGSPLKPESLDAEAWFRLSVGDIAAMLKAMP